MDVSPERRGRGALAAIESLLAFWADAGVEALYESAPIDRTAPRARASPAAVASAPTATPRQEDRPQAASELTLQAQALSLAAAADDLDALGAAADRFLAASLGGGRLVFRRGDDRAEVVVVGGAPDSDDVRQGAPLAGARGRVLDRMLALAGLEGRVLRLNQVWRGGADAPSTQEQAIWAPFLERAIALVAPRAILTVGGPAAQGFTGRTDSILKLRGRWAPWRGAHFDVAAPALPILDPALTLDQPEARRLIWRDIMSLIDGLETGVDFDLGLSP